jgi:DNA repair exonuclease SbcCD ATPase subunit
MSFVGKILIVVQVVLSLCFMAFAGAVYVTQENWREKHTAAEAQIAELNKTRTTIEANLSQARDEAARVQQESQQEINKWKLAFQNEEAEVKDLTNRLNAVTTGLEQQRALASSKQIEADNREKEAEVLRKQSFDLQKRVDELSAELNVEKDKVFNSNVALRQLEERFNELLTKADFLEKVVHKHGLETDPAQVAEMQAPPPPLDGVVEEIQKDRTNRTQFVVLSVGSDDGLRVGNVMDVFRPSEEDPLYLGSVRIIELFPDKAVGEVVLPRVRNGDIEVGDNVTTRL